MNFVGGIVLGASVSSFFFLSKNATKNNILDQRINELTREKLEYLQEINIYENAFVNLIYDSQNMPRPTGLMAISDYQIREKKVYDVFRKYIDESIQNKLKF